MINNVTEQTGSIVQNIDGTWTGCMKLRGENFTKCLVFEDRLSAETYINYIVENNKIMNDDFFDILCAFGGLVLFLFILFYIIESLIFSRIFRTKISNG